MLCKVPPLKNQAYPLPFWFTDWSFPTLADDGPHLISSFTLLLGLQMCSWFGLPCHKEPELRSPGSEPTPTPSAVPPATQSPSSPLCHISTLAQEPWPFHESEKGEKLTKPVSYLPFLQLAQACLLHLCYTSLVEIIWVIEEGGWDGIGERKV